MKKADFDMVMEALRICAYPVDQERNRIRTCRDCPFREKLCIVGLMMATLAVMEKVKPVVDKWGKEGGFDA